MPARTKPQSVNENMVTEDELEQISLRTRVAGYMDYSDAVLVVNSLRNAMSNHSPYDGARRRFFTQGIIIGSLIQWGLIILWGLLP